MYSKYSIGVLKYTDTTLSIVLKLTRLIDVSF